MVLQQLKSIDWLWCLFQPASTVYFIGKRDKAIFLFLLNTGAHDRGSDGERRKPICSSCRGITVQAKVNDGKISEPSSSATQICAWGSTIFRRVKLVRTITDLVGNEDIQSLISRRLYTMDRRC
jgi:hypothetical protein